LFKNIFCINNLEYTKVFRTGKFLTLHEWRFA